MKFTLTCAALLLGLAVMPRALAADAASEAPKPDKDGWYQLFNGKNLDGWKVSEDSPETFKVVDGEIVAHGDVAHLFYDGPVEDHNFKNFEYECEVLTKPKANSGMYFHTKYQPKSWPTTGIEVQVNQTHGDPKKTGSLYNIKNVMDKSPAKDDEWFTQNITVKDNHVTVKVNGKVVNEWTQPADFKRDDWKDAKLGSGTFALQGHDPESETHYRSVKVKPLK
jgi:hypothetical protein